MSSKRAIRRRACERKRRFATLAEARAAARISSWKTGEYIAAYGCPFKCGAYHIGHRRPGQWGPAHP